MENFTNQLKNACAVTRAAYVKALQEEKELIYINQRQWDLAYLDNAIVALSSSPVGANTAAAVRYLVRTIGDGFFDIPKSDFWYKLGVDQDNLRMLEDIESNL